MPDPEPEREYIDPSQVRPGPIRHESLSDEVLAQVEEVFSIIGRYLATTRESFEINLMRDAHPEREVLIWLTIAYAWHNYHEQYLDGDLQTDGDEKRLISALLLISMGEDLSRLQVPDEVGQRLLECYEELWNQE